MNMTEWEICRDYRMAKDKREQIKILADMNCCGKHVIQEILARNDLYRGKINTPKERTQKPKKKQMLCSKTERAKRRETGLPSSRRLIGKEEEPPQGAMLRSKAERAERRVPTRWTQKEIEMVDKLYRQGHKPTYIAQLLGLTVKQVEGKCAECRMKQGSRKAVRLFWEEGATAARSDAP